MEPLDWSVITENCGGDEALVNEVLEMFRSQAAGLLADVGAALAAGDANAVKRAAHRLKGALMSLGALPCTEAVHALEVRGGAGDLTDGAALLTRLNDEMSRLMRALSLPRAA